jgi:hypothetical protein
MSAQQLRDPGRIAPRESTFHCYREGLNVLSRSTQTRRRAFDSIRVVDEPQADFSFWAELKPTQS